MFAPAGYSYPPPHPYHENPYATGYAFSPYQEEEEEPEDGATPYLNQEEAFYYDRWLAQQGEQFDDDDEFQNDGEEFFYPEEDEDEEEEFVPDTKYTEEMHYGQVDILTRQMNHVTLSTPQQSFH